MSSLLGHDPVSTAVCFRLFPADFFFYVPLHTMAAFGIFCPKSIWDKSQFLVPTNNKSDKIKAILLSEF